MRGSYLVASGRYVFISGSSFPAGEGALIDGQTGRRRILSQPGCSAAALGDPWLAFTCGTSSSETFELYNIATGQSQPLTSTVPYQDCAINCVPVAAVGTNWVAFEAPPGDEHVVPTFEFENLNTGAVTDDPTNSTTTINLDSPQLVEQVCQPLSVPAVSNVYSSGWGSLSFDDGYAIASGSGGAYLERCGSRLHEFLTFTTPNYQSTPLRDLGCPHLTCPPAHNSHVIVWQSAAGRLSGLFLPSRQRFAIPVPAKVDPSRGFANGDMYTLALTPRSLYLVSQADQIWSIPSPTRPRSSRHHRG